MYIILPNERNGIASLIQNIQRLTLEKLIFGGTTRELLLQMPKFRIETQINLAQPLTKVNLPEISWYVDDESVFINLLILLLSQLRMGMIFNIDADFSGITDENVRVNTMIQKAYIEVNEMGSEAAAVTGKRLLILVYIKTVKNMEGKSILQGWFLMNFSHVSIRQNFFFFSLQA